MCTELHVLIVYYVQCSLIFSWLMRQACCILIVSIEETQNYFCTLFHIHATTFNGLNQPNILKIHLNRLY